MGDAQKHTFDVAGIFQLKEETIFTCKIKTTFHCSGTEIIFKLGPNSKESFHKMWSGAFN